MRLSAVDEACTTSLPSEAADYYVRLFEHAAVAMIATDARFHVVSLNAAAAELLSTPAEKVLGRPIEQVVPANRRKLLRKLLARTFERGQKSQFEIRMESPPGQMRNLMVVISPIPGTAGDAQGVALWVIDETNQARMTQRLAQAEKMASLGTLASGVAHHFNNILGGVATFVDFALTSGDTVAMKRALQMTAEAAGRASKITQSLLSFAKHDPRRADLADLTEVVLTFVHLVERPLAERNIRLQLDIRPAPIVAVEANRMHQVLGNLLTNSEEAMPAGGVIRIGVDGNKKEVRMTFADTGHGIRPEHLPLIFEPFFTTKGLLAGGDKANPGLGLSVVHGIITELGGRIEVESPDGQGASFTITFPVPKGEE